MLEKVIQINQIGRTDDQTLGKSKIDNSFPVWPNHGNRLGGDQGSTRKNPPSILKTFTMEKTAGKLTVLYRVITITKGIEFE